MKTHKKPSKNKQTKQQQQKISPIKPHTHTQKAKIIAQTL